MYSVDQKAMVFTMYILLVDEAFHARPHTNVEPFSLVEPKQVICMRSSIVKTTQECYGDCMSFEITPNLVQEISSVVYITTLMCLFHLSNRSKCSYLPPKLSRVSGMKTCQIIYCTKKT